VADHQMYTDDERRERHALWVESQIEDRRERFLAKRPEVFAEQGDLCPDLDAWTQRFTAGKAGNLALVGNVGGGKTWSLWKIGERLLDAGFLGRYDIVAAHRLKSLITPPVDETTLRAYTEANLLALDDVAAIRVSDWDSDKLYALLDERWERRRPTIISSNITALGEVLGERAASRFAHGVTVVRFTGPDRRGNR
jgi:DNA replication protein DnaC